MSITENDSLETYQENEAPFDFKSVVPAKIETPDDASRIMYEIDGVIGSLQMEIDIAKCSAVQKRKYLSPKKWVWLNNSIKEAKRKRMAVQDRLGQLNRMKRSIANKTREVAFVNSALALLGHDEWKRIWDHARAANPKLFDSIQTK